MAGELLDFLTAEEIISPARDEAISSSTPQIRALQDTQMIEFTHWLNGEFVLAAHGSHPDIIIPSSFTGWSWMRKTKPFSIYVHNALSAIAAAGAASFSLNSAANWDNSGRSAIETSRGILDFVDHESKASNTLTVSTVAGAETIGIAHAAGNWVHRMPPLPDDFGRMHRLWVNQVPFDEEKFTSQFPNYRKFSIYGQYILLPRGSYTADGSMLYEKAPTEIIALGTETNIPRRFQRWAIYMTLHHLFMVRRKRGDTLTVLQLAELELQKAINYDAITSTSTHIRLAN